METNTTTTELRQNLAAYLAKVQGGQEVKVTLHGKVVARLMPEEDESARAKAELAEIRKTAWVGDVISPIDAIWTGDANNL
ncbi:MAG: type II toxin-antitoxin system prevent-host-death family antitoxin [Sulfuricellaceae bacterium]